MTSHRVSSPTGKTLNFTFDGKAYAGVEGDSLASALLANGVRIMGRSFKYHRPRGPWSDWVDDPNAIMTVRKGGVELPNCAATTTYLEDGMEARAVNAWPSAAFDIKGGLDLLHRWLGAGFYYKTFIWPDWHLFEPAIRKMAGLGHVTDEVLDGYSADQLHDRCDVLVIGGGPAGLSAARVASQAGQDVCLVEDHKSLGGGARLSREIEGMDPDAWVATEADGIVQAGGRILTHATAFGIYDHQMVAIIEHGPFGAAPRLRRMRARRIILASGALDRPVTFANNDRPGIMSVAGACTYLTQHDVLVGRKIALACNNSFADDAEAMLTSAGAQITPIDPQSGPMEAMGGKTLRGLLQSGITHAVDTILASGGQTPLVHLWRHAGGKLDWCEERQAFLPGSTPINMIAVGGARGAFDMDHALAQARAAGQGEARPQGSDEPPRYHLTPLWPDPGSAGRQWIDFQHDVTLKDIELAARENYISVEHLKRYTTLGMASDQGKTSNMAGLAAMATLQGKPIPEVGTTTFRPPFVPVPLEIYHGHHKGQHWNPVKRLALEVEHRAAGAALGEYGGWLRPAWYGAGGMAARVPEEVKAARDGAGLFDASPLGKIEVMGPDAEDFVNFIYYNTIKTLKPGRIRYDFMLSEGGIVYDDGVIARVDEHRFIISCSSSHVDGVRTHLEAWRQDGNDPDRIFIHDTTQHWATLTVTGPKARDVVSGLALEADLTKGALPHMAFLEATWQDAPLRIARVSFSGDLSFELSIRRSKAQALWHALREAGAIPIGLEAMAVMRAEKGYIMIGKDTDGETMPHDLGFTVPREKKTAAFVGDRSLHMEVANDPARKQLVGLAVTEGSSMLPIGAHVVTDDAKPKSLGYVTSSYESPVLNAAIAIGLVENGHARMGESVTVWNQGETREAVITSPVFFDPDGERLRA
ncbi:MAG: 2Fe-2S iron-sulfur cluster-binding protein [Pseudomonadota bacterium]